MGTHSWFCVPTLLCSRVPSILGQRVRGKANYIQERGNAECKRIGTLNLHSCAEMTGHTHSVKQVCPSAVVNYGPVIIIPPPPHSSTPKWQFFPHCLWRMLNLSPACGKPQQRRNGDGIFWSGTTFSRFKAWRWCSVTYFKPSCEAKQVQTTCL